jgi:hypothetical protein
MRRKGNRDSMSLRDRFVHPRMQQEGPNLSALRQDNGAVLLLFFYVEEGNSWTSYERCSPDATR